MWSLVEMGGVNGGGKEKLIQEVRDMPPHEQAVILGQMLNLVKREHREIAHIAASQSRSEFPLSIFSQDKLSSLESIVKYLKESKSMTLGKIAKLLNRDNRTIWSTYSNASRKMPEPLILNESLFMPISTIADRKLSVLEHVVSFVKSKGLTNHEIGLLLHLDDRTIWSVLHKVRVKKGEL
jgi:DNA-binding NarL/FixJ family response regulator